MKEMQFKGEIEVELTGLAVVRQRRTIHVEEPLDVPSVMALAKATEGNHVWEYRGMREDTIEVHILSQPFVPEKQRADEDILLACIAPDGCPGVYFDASPWLREASEQEIRLLRETTVEDRYRSNLLAQRAGDDDAHVEAVITYCEATELGLACTVPIRELYASTLTLRNGDV